MHIFTELIAVWSVYFAQCNLQEIMLTHTPITTGCGLVYELPNVPDRAHESCAIVDMRNIAWTEPHYHIETEVYFVLQGSGLIVINGDEQAIASGDVIVVPSNKAHFVIPRADLIIGVINTPPFNAENYIPLTQSNSTVGFDRNQFDALTRQAAHPIIEISEIKPHHTTAAKDIFYHIIHEYQFIDTTCVQDAEAFCLEHNVCKDYDDPDTHYFNNRGTFLVVLENNKVIGTGGIKFFNDETCELKRFFFTPEARGRGLARGLMQKLITHAHERGYKKMCLEICRPQAQVAAIRFYTKWGFYEIPHYRETHSLLSMEMDL